VTSPSRDFCWYSERSSNIGRGSPLGARHHTRKISQQQLYRQQCCASHLRWASHLQAPACDFSGVISCWGLGSTPGREDHHPVATHLNRTSLFSAPAWVSTVLLRSLVLVCLTAGSDGGSKGHLAAVTEVLLFSSCLLAPRPTYFLANLGSKTSVSITGRICRALAGRSEHLHLFCLRLHPSTVLLIEFQDLFSVSHH